MAARGGACRAALALLALLLLACGPLGALAACTAGSLTLDLVTTGGGSCNSNPYAVCMASFRIDVASSCNIAIEPLLASNDYVAGIWSSNSAGTYGRLVACPTWAREAVVPAGGSNATPAQMKAAIKLAIERQIYGSDYPQTLSSMTFVGDGELRLTTTIPGSCTLDYAITAVTTSDYASQIDAMAVLVDCGLPGITCVLDPAQSGCGAGNRASYLSGPLGYACVLCPAGTFSTNGNSTSCTACGTGQASGSVGATSSGACADCAAGTYASSTGQSTCLPCNPGTYQASTGQTTCISCPATSYARLPGADQCVKCVAGIAYKCINGDCSNDAPTPGYHVLSVTTANSLPSATCALSGTLSYGNPLLFQQCTLTPSNTTLLSVYVDKTCAVEISPLQDTACAEPGQSYWSSIRIRGHYVTPTKISTMLNTASTNLTSSYLLTLVPATGTTLTMTYWPATTDESKANDLAGVSKTCSGTVTVIGGTVVNVDSGVADCPAGSYDSAAVDGCRPCPVGNTCAQGSTTPTSCSADQYQPYLGGASCLQCNALADPRYTSNAGDDYCLVPWVDTSCGNGQEYDPVTKQCQLCDAGFARNTTREDSCVPCAPGYYSEPGATDCTICPLNQFSPVWGLANRTAGDQKCIYCATGFVAVNDNDEVGQQGSTGCMACNPGQYAAIVSPRTYHTCEACDDGYYRSGDSSPYNNVCRKIPDGYKEKNRTITTYDRAEIVPCNKGEVSSWAGATRTPTDPEQCRACSGDNTYAQRMGMRVCAPCPGGTYPTKSVGTLPGNDQCTRCSGSTYRSVSSTSPTCDSCLAGRETNPSANTMCIPCDAGYYMPDDLGGSNLSRPANGTTCLPCPVNTYQPNTGRANCIQCPPGFSTQDSGNAACTACPLGMYSPSSAANCVGAPAGTFVNVTGAKAATACPKGTYSNEVGASECEPCAAGQYSNTDGGRICKTCPAGTYSGGGAPTCKPCNPGFYSTPGSGMCSPCKPGAYASGSRTATCAACPKGYQCPTIATKSPQPCPRGYYSNKDGLRLCLPCAVNMYRNTTGGTSCIVCPSGYSTRGLTGQSACQPLARTFRRLQL